jgi:hypothetical protein
VSNVTPKNLSDANIDSEFILTDHVSDTRDHHYSEIIHVESLMRANRSILESQISKYSDQMQKLVESDVLVKRLYAENETLVMAIQTLEDGIRADVEEDDEDARGGNLARSRECLEAVQEALLTGTVFAANK